jgi:predicted ArsR family transcriptional regulator
MSDTEEVLVPAYGRLSQGIKRRKRIRELLDNGLSKNQICGELDISSQALSRHLRIIKEEDAGSSDAKTEGAA